MKLHNSDAEWGWIAIINHWFGFILLISLFILGLWMVELTYYNAWYHKAPHIHKSVGLIFLVLTFFRFFWRLIDLVPVSLETHARFEQLAAKVVHKLLYVLLFATMFSGYFISTADGRAIEVFNWFEVPALFAGIDKQEDIAGNWHYWLAMVLMLLVLFHSMAAFKHHVIDKDNTLKRMLGKN